MKQYEKRMLQIVISVGLVLAGFAVFAQTGYWTGAGADGKWTNVDNWRDGVIPGRYTVNDVTQGDFGDTAVFGAVAAGAHTTVVLGNGLLTIGTIRVTGADAPGYTFGNAANENQALKLEAGGGFVVDGDVVNAPTFTGYLYNATQVEGVSPTCITFENNSTQTLDLPVIREATGNTQIAFKGSGDIRLNGEFKSNSETWILNQTGRLIVNTELDGRVWGKYAPMNIKAGTDTALARVVINKDCKLRQRYQYQHYLDCTDGDIEFSGEGEFVDNGYSASASDFANGLLVKVPVGRTLTFASRFSTSQNTTISDDFGFRISTGGGTVRFSGTNAMLGYMDVFKVTIETPDTANGLGLRGVRLGYSGVLKYTGAGETTATAIRLCSLDRDVTSGTLCHSGTGPWKIEDFALDAAANKDGTLTLAGEGDGAEITAALADAESGKTLAITKKDGGTWTLSGANTFTGATTVNGGVLKVAKTGSLASSSGVTVNGGSLAFEGSEDESVEQSLAKLTVSANATLTLTGKVTVKPVTLSFASGKTIDIVTTSTDAKLVVPAGTSASSFTWNGQPAVIDANGEVKIDADAVIAARGDVVPDNVGKVVIFNPGTTGNDTLAADTTTVGSLWQLSKTASTVEIGANCSLLVQEVGLSAGAADLTLGAAGDKGTLDSSTKTIAFDNRSEESKITLNAAIGAGVSGDIAQGVVTIKGDMSLRQTKIAIADKAKAQLEIRGCTIDTGIEPITIGKNDNASSGGGIQYGELTVSNAVIRNVTDLARASHSYSTTAEYALEVGRNASGILRVQDGAVVSNKLQVGTTGSSYSGRGSGAVYQSGGSVCTIGSTDFRNNALGTGQTAMGYYELTGGTFDGYLGIGVYGYGIWHQGEGTTADLKALNVASANGGQGDVYIRGSVLAKSGGSSLCAGYSGGNTSVLTLDGPDASLDCYNNSVYAFASDSSMVGSSQINISNGGSLKSARIYNNAKSGVESRLGLSFDGGTFICGYSGYSEVFGVDSGKFTDDIRIYKGGMTVETIAANANNGTAVQLRSPEGKGVSAIPFDFASFAKWNCPPLVKISGDGTGATAHALFDSSSQSVTGVVITCSGTGYTWAKATAGYKGNSCPSSTTVDCILADNDTTGGFTKAGVGTFTLNNANTYRGATVVKGGTLKAGVDNAIPADAEIVLAGGTLDFNGKAGNVSKITYTVGGGSVVNAGNVTLPTTFEMAITVEEVLTKQSVPLTGDQDLTGKTLTITGDFSSLDPEVCRKYTVVSVTGGTISGEPTIVAPALPKGWSFVTRPNGVKLVNPLGMLMIVR